MQVRGYHWTQYRLRTLLMLPVVVSVFMGAVLMFGAIGGALALGVVLAVGVCGIGRQDVRRAWLFLAVYCAAQPLLFAAVFSWWASFGASIEPARLDATLGAFHLSALAASGPLGIAVTAELEWNFPYDRNWMYLFALLGVSWSQWAAVWWLGDLILRRHNTPSLRLFATLVLLVALTFGCAFMIHFGLLVGRHS